MRCLGRRTSVAVISFVKTTSQTADLLAAVSDYLLWYAKDITLAKRKYHQLFLQHDVQKLLHNHLSKISNSQMALPGIETRRNRETRKVFP